MKKLYIFLTFFFLSSCNSIIKTVYDDTSARYNAYFLANEEIKSIESDYGENLNKSYDSLINLTYKIDTNSISGIKDRTESSIKKLSILIQRQSTSKYVYPSYALIGKSRLLNLDLRESITTLKYVNSKSNNKEANTMALVYLLRAYTEKKDYNSAIEVDKFLSDKEMSEDIKIEYYKNSYHLFKILNDEDRLLFILLELEKLNLKKELANKVYFAIGQIYYNRNSASLSKEYFKKCLKNSPNINMGFFAKIFIAKTNDISYENQTLKEFQKLLRDKKNIEYKDRIYFELARYYLKNNRYDDAIDNFMVAIRENNSDKNILFNSYLEIAKVFYEEKNDYEKSQKYYDSAITNINRENKLYEKIKERSETLNNLVKNINVISKNDSLIELSKLSKVDLDKLINDKIKEENKKNKKQNKAINQTSYSTQEPSVIKVNSGDGTWYFDNPMLISSGIVEFQRVWGKRVLVDNWRLTSKAQFSVAETIQENEGKEIKEDSGEENETDYDKFYSSVPFKEEEIKKLNLDTENSMAEVGRIYIQNLIEIEKGISVYENFIKRFPNSEKIPDIYYQLYLISDNKNLYRNKILNDFSNSIFAKLINNPNYEIDEFQEYNYLLDVYRRLYQNLSQNQNNIVIKKVDSLSSYYSKNEFFQNIVLLKSIAIGKKEGNFSLQFELKYFLSKATEQSAIEYATILLKSAERVHKEYVFSGLPKFKKNKDKRSFFVLVNNEEFNSTSSDNLNKILLEINEEYYRDRFYLTNKTSLEIVLYNDISTTEKIYKKFNKLNITEDLKGNTNFVIGEKNLNLIFRSKNYKEFEKFI